MEIWRYRKIINLFYVIIFVVYSNTSLETHQPLIEMSTRLITWEIKPAGV